MSATPGTTRDFIEDEVSLDGLRFRFVDTAGLRDHPADEVEAIGVQRTRQRIAQAALLLYLFDLNELTPAEVAADVAALTAELPNLPVLLVGNKRDTATAAQQAAFEKIETRSNAKNSQQETTNEKQATRNKKHLLISAKQKNGLESLQAALLAQVRGAGLAGSGAATIVTNVRHARALETAAGHLTAVETGLAIGRGTELLAADLRHALNALGEITGEISSEDLLTSIFTQFCIGK